MLIKISTTIPVPAALPWALDLSTNLLMRYRRCSDAIFLRAERDSLLVHPDDYLQGHWNTSIWTYVRISNLYTISRQFLTYSATQHTHHTQRRTPAAPDSGASLHRWQYQNLGLVDCHHTSRSDRKVLPEQTEEVGRVQIKLVLFIAPLGLESARCPFVGCVQTKGYPGTTIQSGVTRGMRSWRTASLSKAARRLEDFTESVSIRSWLKGRARDEEFF